MAFNAKVIRVLIASPSDTEDERMVIPEVINEWNSSHALSSNVILMPVKWETNSTPSMGGTAQSHINDQLVNNCDLLIGIFWTRIGTKTAYHISGTAEEIDHFVESKRPVMLYFSQREIDPDKLDLDQYTKLKEFKNKMKSQGLVEFYANLVDFRQKFSRHLQQRMHYMIEEMVHEPVPKQGKTDSIVKITSIESDKVNEWLNGDKIDEFLLKAVDNMIGENGWALVAAVGGYLTNYTPIEYKSLGFKTLTKFIQSKPHLFETKLDKISSAALTNDTAYVRRKTRVY